MNKYAKTTKVLGWVVLILGVIGSFVFFLKTSNFIPFFLGLLSTFILSMILLCIGEITNILDENRFYLKKMADNPSEMNNIMNDLPNI